MNFIIFCRDVAKAFQVGDTAVAKQVLVKMKYYSSIAARIKDLKQNKSQ
jgi:hypothetical protein